jgi:hypothetical protein
VYQTATRADAGTLARHESFMTKIVGTDLGFRVADRCMQISRRDGAGAGDADLPRGDATRAAL